MDEEIIKKAQSGDSQAFDQVAAWVRPILSSYLFRRLGDLDQAEDLCQDTLLQAYSHLKELRGPAVFEEWVYRLAHQNCEPLLSEKEPWSSDSLDILQNYILQNSGAEKHLQETYFNYEEDYTLADHVDFCFTVLGKSLFHAEQNIFLLRELVGLSTSGVANVAGESPEKVEQKLKEATDQLTDIFWERCSLVRKGAPCTQCQDFGNWLNDETKTEAQLKELPFEEDQTDFQSFVTRLELIQDRDPFQSTSKRTHEILMGFIRRALGEKGVEE